MSNTPGSEGVSDYSPLFVAQQQLQQEAYQVSQDSRFTDALGLLSQAAEHRDVLVDSHASEKWSVEASISFNEGLHAVLQTIGNCGEVPLVETIMRQRLQKTANAHEAMGLLSLIGMHEAGRGNLLEAITKTKAAEAIAIDIGSPWLVAPTQTMLCKIYSDIGDESLARTSISNALDNIEAGEQSALHTPERYKVKAAYTIRRSLRYYLGERLYSGRQQQVLRFCDEVLTTSPDLLRKGFLHHWMGQAACLQAELASSANGYGDFTKAAQHLQAAEDCFTSANQPIYAGFAALDRGPLKDLRQALGKGASYIRQAGEQYGAGYSPEHSAELRDLIISFSRMQLRASAAAAMN